MNEFKKTLMSITNGNVIQDTFPNGLVLCVLSLSNSVAFMVDGKIIMFDRDWWDAPYCGKGE